MASTESSASTHRGVGRRILSAGVVGLTLILAWHVYLTLGLASRVRSLQDTDGGLTEEVAISVNPFTNLISITFAMPPELEEDNPFSALGAMLGQAMIQAVAPGMIERELNTQARVRYDLLAMVIPYRVRVTTEAASPEALAGIREREAAQRAEEERAEAEAEAARLSVVRDYVAFSLSLEGVRVAQGERFGQAVDGVFGTLVNNGTQSLRVVRVRFYFLDADGRRVGEKEFAPILVTEFSFGDNTPLRPGYRKDFGYNVEEDAPSGWAKRVEAEIVDVEFMQPDANVSGG